MNAKYILVQDEGVIFFPKATLYRLDDQKDELAPIYVKVSHGPLRELTAIAHQLNEREQPGEGELPVPLGKVDPLAAMEVENLDRIIHDTKPRAATDSEVGDYLRSAIGEIPPAELAEMRRIRNTTGKDEPILTEEQWGRIKEQANEDQWTRLEDPVTAFLSLSEDTIKAQSLTSWLSHRGRSDTIRIRQVDGKIQIRAEKADR